MLSFSLETFNDSFGEHFLTNFLKEFIESLKNRFAVDLKLVLFPSTAHADSFSSIRVAMNKLAVFRVCNENEFTRIAFGLRMTAERIFHDSPIILTFKHDCWTIKI